MDDATRLTPDQIEQLRAEARGSGPFVDPAALAHVTQSSFYGSWASAIIGRNFPGVRRLEPWEVTLISLALKAEPDRPVPAVEAARQEVYRREQEEGRRIDAEAADAERATWNALRGRLPVPVTVGHNWTIGHWSSGYVTGREHIVVQADLRVGRLVRRARRVLCETPGKCEGKRARNGTDRDPLRGVDRDDDGQDRIPTCAACLRVAERIADKENGAAA